MLYAKVLFYIRHDLLTVQKCRLGMKAVDVLTDLLTSDHYDGDASADNTWVNKFRAAAMNVTESDVPGLPRAGCAAPLTRSVTARDRSLQLKRDAASPADAMEIKRARVSNSPSADVAAEPSADRGEDAEMRDPVAASVSGESDSDEPRFIERRTVRLIEKELAKKTKENLKMTRLLTIAVKTRQAHRAQISILETALENRPPIQSEGAGEAIDALRLPQVWLTCCVPLGAEQRGKNALVGTALLLRAARPWTLSASAVAPTGVQPQSVHLCIYKQSYVLNGDMSPFYSEIDVLACIFSSPHIHLPKVFGVTGMLQRVTKDSAAAAVVQCAAVEYLRGMNLNDWLNEASDADDRSMPQRLRILRQLACGIQHLHRIGVAHRDLHPGNIMIHSASIYARLLSGGKLRVTKRTPVAGDAERSCLVDGFAPDQENTPLSGDPVELYRVVVIDFNLSLVVKDALMTLGKAREIRVGTHEYSRHTLRPSSKSSLNGWSVVPSVANDDVQSYWLRFDYYALALTMMDVLRGAPLQFAIVADRSKKLSAAYSAYCLRCLSQTPPRHPSVFGYLNDEPSDGFDALWESGAEFSVACERLRAVLKGQPYEALCDALHRMTAEAWCGKDATGATATLSVVMPTHEEIETLLATMLLPYAGAAPSASAVAAVAALGTSEGARDSDEAQSRVHSDILSAAASSITASQSSASASAALPARTSASASAAQHGVHT
jgi:hypothetical protein